jgi:hypothetical protein
MMMEVSEAVKHGFAKLEGATQCFGGGAWLGQKISAKQLRTVVGG